MSQHAQASPEVGRTQEVGLVGNSAGKSPLVLVCEHASNAIPPHLLQLGVTDDVVNSHVAWDPGAMGLTQKLSNLLNAPNVLQTVSRLVYDCNRPFNAPSATPEKSEIFEIPGNANLTNAARLDRKKTFYEPFREKVAHTIKLACDRHQFPLVVTIHTFTPIYFGKQRPVEIGVLHDLDVRLADQLLQTMQDDQAYVTERNQPYGPDDGVTHTLHTHAIGLSLPSVMIEVRNDLLRNDDAEQKIAEYLAQHLRLAIDFFFAKDAHLGAQSK